MVSSAFMVFDRAANTWPSEQQEDDRPEARIDESVALDFSYVWKWTRPGAREKRRCASILQSSLSNAPSHFFSPFLHLVVEQLVIPAQVLPDRSLSLIAQQFL
jgi:hypothetical protein